MPFKKLVDSRKKLKLGHKSKKQVANTHAMTERGPSIFRLHSAALARGSEYTNRLSYADLVSAESEIGRTLFGPIPEGHRREFFEQRKNVWVWYEQWTDQSGKEQEVTVRYEVRPNGVYKKYAGAGYQMIKGDELQNFCRAVKLYFQLVCQKLYS